MSSQKTRHQKLNSYIQTCHSYETRQRYAISIQYASTILRKKCLRFSIPNMTNTYPNTINDKIAKI